MPYNAEVEHSMRMFYDSLSEKDRRRYAAIEVAKLGHGGTEYVAAVAVHQCSRSYRTVVCVDGYIRHWGGH